LLKFLLSAGYQAIVRPIMEKVEAIKTEEATQLEQVVQPERPFIDEFPSGFRLRWVYGDIEFAADVTHITDKAIAEVTWFYSLPESDKETLLLSTTRIDFLAPTQRANHVKQLRGIGYLDQFIQFVDWERKINHIALAVLQHCRKDMPAVDVIIDDDIPLAAEYVVKPILYKDAPNVIFGDYGSYKSVTAMILAYIAQLPYPDNELDLAPGQETATNCLWLDYEGQPVSFKQRWAAIQHGFHLDIPEERPLQMPIRYKEMTVPVYDAVESLQYEMTESHIGMLVIDSLGPAAGGNLNDPEPAIRYHQALRTLGGTSLTLAHNSKDLNTGTKSIFGSVFFSNLARSIWQCKAEKEPMDSRGTISLKQVKASLSQLHGAIGFSLDFDEEANKITVKKSDLRDTSLSGDLPLRTQIKNLLRQGAMTSPDIAETLDANKGSVRAKLSALLADEIVVKNGDLWGLREP